MRFTVDDTEYDVDLDHLTYDELEFVNTHTDLGLWEFADGLKRGVPKAIKALVLLGKRRAGLQVRWQDLDGATFDMSAAAMAVLEGIYRPVLEAPTGDDGGGGRPTTPGSTPESEPGTDPANDETATSSDSPTTSG